MALYLQKIMETIILAAQNGDHRAFEKLANRFYNRAFAVALAQLGNYHQAQDAVQEAFVEVYLRLPQLQMPAAFSSWLTKIVLGKCVRVLRSGKSVLAPLSLETLRESISLEREPETALLEMSVREILRQAVDRLSEEEREALLLFAVGGYRYAEIATIMELPLSVVRKRIYTARQRLQKVEELSVLRPLQRDDFGKRMREQAVRREQKQKEKTMVQEESKYAVELLGPGVEIKIAVKNLYAFSRYEELMYLHYEVGQLTPPNDVTAETWRCGAWVNQYGVINGLHSETHEQGVLGEDQFWEWPNIQAYLVKLNGWPAGFATVTSPPNATKGVDYRLQELFIINKARRKGIGSRAAQLLFERLPGRWELAYNPEIVAATAFWRKFIPEFTGGDFTEEMIGMGGPDLPGYVFTKGPRPQHPIRVR